MTEHEIETEDGRSELLGALVNIGGVWARYGLKVGRMALESSAETLQATAQSLEGIAERLEDEREDRKLSSADRERPRYDVFDSK